MYSLWCSNRAISNVSSSTAYCALKIWHIARFNSNHRLASYDVCSLKHQACSSRTPPRDIDFSDFLLKTLRVLVHCRIFRPSHVHLLGGAYVSRPHHCLRQWLSTVFPTSSLPPATACEQSVCGRPPGQPQRCSALIHEEQMTGPRAFDFVVPMHPSRCSSTCTIQSGSFSGYSRLQRRQFFSVTSSLLSAMIGSGNFVILVLDVINLPLCTARTSTSPESIHRYTFQSVVLRSCVTAFPSW